ncbi:MAG: efflux RND transporter periplasmic adaptor subunit [Terracidiphilus sp.]|jgi:RND family efflux transporter MFP subunit
MSNEIKPGPDSAARPAAGHEHAPEQEPISTHKVVIALVVVLIAAVVLAGLGMLARVHANTALAQRTDAAAAPTVAIAPAKPGAPVDEFVLPGNVTAYTDAPIYARTDGYLVHWYFDIGAHVKKGDLLAIIDTPELDKQVAQAEADLVTAQTNAGNAKVQADRYAGLVKSDAVSQIDTDTFTTQAAATSSAVKSAEANLERLREMQSFEKVYAPFSGVVTARNVDTGQLISQGSATELFRLQALDTLRVYTNVPQLYTQTLKRGMKVPLSFPEYPGKSFQGTLVRTADAIDPASRTLLVEVDVNNRSGELMPGALAQVHFKTPPVGPTFIVPTAALIFRHEGLQVGTVQDSSNGTIAHLKTVTIGEDDGASVQIVSGLNPGDQVIQDPPDSLIDGQKVTVEQPASATHTVGGL